MEFEITGGHLEKHCKFGKNSNWPVEREKSISPSKLEYFQFQQKLWVNPFLENLVYLCYEASKRRGRHKRIWRKRGGLDVVPI